MYKKILTLLAAFICQSCFLFTDGDNPRPKPEGVSLPRFEESPLSYPVNPGPLDEASGMVVSKSMSGNLWLINDGTNSAAIHLLSKQGEYRGKVDIWNVDNRDWEELAAGPGPESGVNYLYIAETGDNLEVYGEYKIIRLKEPNSLGSGVNADVINFKYEDNRSLDVETVFVDPNTKDIYLISKRELYSLRVYKLEYPYSLESQNTAKFLGTIPFTSLTAADISQDGKEIILKDYFAIFYWRLGENETIFQALSRKRDLALPYAKEVQGECLCFDEFDSGYYTFSERGESGQTINLNYYARKVEQ